MAEICFIEAKPRNVASGVEATVRLAGGGRERAYYRGGVHYRAGVVDMPRFKALFGFDDNGWTGGTVPTSGAINFMPGDPSLIAQLAAYYWRDAAITVDGGDEATEPTRRLSGTVMDMACNDGQMVIGLADPSKLLDKPLLGAGFAGTGGIEGPAEATGRAKRRSWGRVFNVEGELLDKANNIYEFGDPSKSWQAFDAVRDMGRAGAITIIGWQGSVAATFAALQAAVAPEGGCAAAPSIACVKWWTVPAGPLTADIRGEVEGGYIETAVGIAARMLAAAGGPALANFAAANALRPASCGVHIASAVDTVAQAIDRLFLGVSLYWVLQPDATIRVGEWAWSAPVASFEAQFIGRERHLPPVKSRKVGYRRNHRPHQGGEISVAATGNLLVQPYPPSGDISAPGQMWLDTDGRYWTRRADIGLSIGAAPLMIGDEPLTVAWTPNGTQPLIDAFEAAQLLALDAQATADGKVQSFYQSAAPVAEGAGDLWFKTDTQKWYVAAAAGAAAIAPGQWELAEDQGIGAALTAAAGAQATADGKVTTFVGEGAPTAEGDGDLWFKPSTKELRRWSASGGSWGDPLADLTAAAQVTIVPAVTQTINRDHTGVPKGGQLPRILVPTVTRGGADFRTNDLISYSVTATGGCEGHVSVNNTAGHADKGKVTIAATMTGPGTVLLSASVGGVSQGSFSTKVEVKDDDPPPASGGGSSQSTSNLLSTNSTTQANLMQAPTYLEVAAGSAGQIALAATLQYSADFVEIGGYDFYIQWQKWNGSAWVNIGTEQSASPVAYKEPGEGDQWDGSISASFTDTGLTPSTSYRYRLVGRIIGKTSRQRHPYGVCSATGS